MAFSTVVAFNRFPERASIHTVAFHRLALVGRGNNLGGFSQYDHLIFKNYILYPPPPAHYFKVAYHFEFLIRFWGFFFLPLAFSTFFDRP